MKKTTLARSIKLIDSSFLGITGSTIKIDKNGDSEGNFSVLALKEENFSFRENFTCSFNMVPVAYFQEGDDFPVISHF